MKQPNATYSRTDRGWQNMEAMLEKEMPPKKRRYLIIIWLLAGIAILWSTNFFIQPINDEHLADSTQSIISENQSPITLAEHDNVEVGMDKRTVTTALINESKIEGNISPSVSNSNSTINKSIININDKQAIKSSQYESIVEKNEISRNTESKNKFIVLNAKKYNNTSSNTSTNTPIIYQAEAKDNINELPLINKREFNLIYNEYLPAISIALAESHIRVEDSFDTGIHIGALIGGEYLIDFKSPGVMGGVIIEKPISKSLSIGSQLAYSINKRTITDEDGLLNQDVDIPTVEDTNTGTLSTIESISVLKSSTGNLNAWMTNLYAKYKFNKGLSLKLSVGFDYYLDHLRLINESFNEINLSSENLYQIEKGNKIIPITSLGLEYNIHKGISVFAEYRVALEDYYTFELEKINTTKASLGLTFSL